MYFALKGLGSNLDARNDLIKRASLFLQVSDGQLLQGLVCILWDKPSMNIPARMITDILKMLLRHADILPAPAMAIADSVDGQVSLNLIHCKNNKFQCSLNLVYSTYFCRLQSMDSAELTFIQATARYCLTLRSRIYSPAECAT